MMQLLLGTSNPGKILEIREVLKSLPIEILTPSAIGIEDTPEEEGETFTENAVQKARFYFERSGGIPTVADDSGIMVEALKGELGIHTRRWGVGKDASDSEWIAYFLERMGREQNKNSRFTCVLAYIDSDGVSHLFEGHCDGRITDTLEAEYLPGLPISACFRPDGFNLVYSALAIEEKNKISHRGRALAPLKAKLSE